MHLVSLYTYCRMMHGAYIVRVVYIFTHIPAFVMETKRVSTRCKIESIHFIFYPYVLLYHFSLSFLIRVVQKMQSNISKFWSPFLRVLVPISLTVPFLSLNTPIFLSTFYRNSLCNGFHSKRQAMSRM